MTSPEQPETVAPGLGGAVTNTACAYSLKQGTPLCGADPVAHIVSLRESTRTVVDLFACTAHIRNAQVVAPVIDQHPYTATCEQGQCRAATARAASTPRP